jgi:hypothetical protein
MNDELEELESFFKSVELPKGELKMSASATIINVAKFVDSHLSILKANLDNKLYQPHYNRLVALKKMLIKKNKKNGIQS